MKMELVVKVLLFLTAFSIFQPNVFAISILDSSFGSNGMVVTNFGENSFSSELIAQPDGKIIVVGSLYNPNSQYDFLLARYNSNGSLDASFGSNGVVVSAISPQSESISAVALQNDGKIVVAGSKSNNDDTSDFVVARYNSNGSLDLTFANAGILIFNQDENDVFYDVAVQPDNKIVAVGMTKNLGNAIVARFNSNGTFDNTFASNGIFTPQTNFPTTIISSIVLLADRSILVGGTFQNFLGQSLYNSNFLIKLDGDGNLNPAFGNQGYAIFTRLDSSGNTKGLTGKSDIAILPDGKILSAGAILVRFLSNGNVDQNFLTGDASVYEIATFPNGKYVATDFFDTPGIALYMDERFIGGDRVLNGRGVIVQSDGKIVLLNDTESNFELTRINAFASNGTRKANLDRDETTDIAVYRPSNHTFYQLPTYNGSIISRRALTPVSAIIPEIFYTNTYVPVYWTNSGIGTLGIFYGSYHFNGPVEGFQWGVGGDIPVGGDYDGDGHTDFTVFRPENGTWYILSPSNNLFHAVQFGQSGDKLVPADYDYDGITDVAVWRPANGVWYVLRSSDGGFSSFQFGANGDIPLTGDFDGDGRADYVVYRPSNGIWYLLDSTEGFRAVQFGVATDQPVPGDYDGDGRHDIAVFRDGIWYILQSRDGFKGIQWGAPDDIPVAVKY